jgi:hypothetical protein
MPLVGGTVAAMVASIERLWAAEAHGAGLFAMPDAGSLPTTRACSLGTHQARTRGGVGGGAR